MGLVSKRKPLVLLPGLSPMELAVAHGKDLVSALFVKGENGPIRISIEHEGGFIVEVDARALAAGLIGDVGENCPGKGVTVEVQDSRVFDLKL